MPDFNIESFDNRVAYQNFLSEQTYHFENIPLLDSPLLPLNLTQKRDELAAKVEAFLIAGTKKGFFTTRHDEERAVKLRKRAALVPDPVINRKVVTAGVLVLVAGLAIGVTSRFNVESALIV